MHGKRHCSIVSHLMREYIEENGIAYGHTCVNISRVCMTANSTGRVDAFLGFYPMNTVAEFPSEPPMQNLYYLLK